MYRLSLIVFLVITAWSAFAQNPHGDDFIVNCGDCHNADTWEISIDTFHFNHDTTAFQLSGQHLITNCISCHTDLIFKGTQSDCISCHSDIHSMSVGNDCIRCHTSDSWLVDNIPELHESNGFPLLGAHFGLFCVDCHQSETQLRFDRLGNECVNCHLDDYESTTQPNHESAGYSKECSLCHSSNSFGWEADVLDHSFFPLTLGHAIRDCSKCHLNEDLSIISSDCISCHLIEYESTVSPDHELLEFDFDCVQCHTTNPGWTPAEFISHDNLYFPIYSGSHEGEWNECVDCHTDPTNFSEFRCTNCHSPDETNDEHEEVSGYVYEDKACYACHPNGESEGSFDHNSTDFPLTGSHIGVDCLECHSDGFTGTSSDCFSCHEVDFNETTNPDHVNLNLSNDCAACHTTEPDWNPARFDIHVRYYELKGAHALIADDCAACHDGDYNNTPSNCYSCHIEDYNMVTDPNHQEANFSLECTQCHTENAWIPSTFDHDAQYFPIYSGKHDGEWSECIDCHTIPGNFSEFTCTTCHENPETDNEHDMVSGYIYQDDACLACHPNGDADMTFDHSQTAFPLTGAHVSVNCFECHEDGFENTPMDCFSCHAPDYDSSVNPNHQELNISTDCINCHTTEPDWNPARFDNHDQYYVLNGAHSIIADDCIACHNGDYINTPSQCIGCHQDDYNSVIDPNHSQANFSTDCTQCHTEDAWLPSTFDHDAEHFPIYSGKHDGEWTECIDCHTNPGVFSEFTCTNCHINPETNIQHETVSAYIYQDIACLACHPSGDADMAFDHDMTDFPLTGEHIGLNCFDCHQNGFENTSTDCFSCHATDFQASVNPNHSMLSISTNCIECHTTDPDWMPASFSVHNNYYQLNGAHALIADDCMTCHNGDYVNTPNTCIGCHQEEYNATTNPNHLQAQFGTDCASCHTEDAWLPATFDHDAQYFPIYSGAHMGVWSECTECHTDINNFAVFSCVSCHLNPETDIEHTIVGGYIYEDNACLACHPAGDADMAFDHNATAFPLTGGHIGVDCLDCHMNGFVDTPMNCDACHLPDYNASTNPNHSTLGLPQTCDDCHTTEPGWIPATFDIHDQYYLLTGEHQVIADNCIVCHDGDYVNTPNSCDGCHISDYNAATNPNHLTLGIPITCETCHTTDPDWKPATFDIHDDYYELVEAHELIADDCVACHNGDYNNTPNTCVGCHLDDYNSTTNPNHSQAQFNTDCEMCHTQTSWIPSTFDHDAMYFPIYSGTHLDEWTTCMECHTNPNNLAEFSCIVCHLNPETDDEHVLVGGYIYEDNACLACHPIGESSGAFDHNDTSFPLTGAHDGLDCLDCHMNGYMDTPTNCDACHMPDYNASTNPDHPDLAIPVTCDDCHTTEPGWIPAAFDIHDQYYTLTGAHLDIATDCVACHNGDYVNTPNTCDGCHINDYNASVNPDHIDLNLPVTCESCHTTDPDWKPATFDIHDDYYELLEAHALIADDCVACHDGDYNNTPNTCVGCHLDDYNSTTNPNHSQAQFNTDCEMCHTQTSWIPSTFDHDAQYFPIYSGTHLGEWSVCMDCHTNPNNLAEFSCIVCHMNPETDDEHVGVGGYIYEDNACLVCHPTGESAGAFDHNNTAFPLTGAHDGLDCLDCHMNGYIDTPTNCDACHMPDYNASTNPDHPDLAIPLTCDDCHTTDPGWIPATFDIHDQFYILTGAHLDIATDCVACHNGDYNNTPNTCDGCHMNDYNASTNPDHPDLAIPITCADCHTTDSGWIPATFDIHNQYYPLTGGASNDTRRLCTLPQRRL